MVDRKAHLYVRDSASDGKDFLKWSWAKGSATASADFGDPIASTDYFLCIYDDGAKVSSTILPAGGSCAGKPCWTTTKTGFTYKDKDLTPDGVVAATLKSGAAAKAEVTVTAKGINLETPNPAALTGPVRVQLQRGDAAVCFESVFSAPFKKNAKGTFSDSAD